MQLSNEIKEKTLSFFVCLFLLSIVGFIIGANSKYKWLHILSFIIILPACNMWIWQLAEWKRGKNFANVTVTVSIAISFLAIAHIIDKGSLGIIPIILTFVFCIIYFGWIAVTFFLASETWWLKSIVVLGICVFAGFLWIVSSHSIKIETNNLDSIVYMDMFKDLNPPFAKKEFIKKYGTPENIDVEYEHEDNYKYKVVSLEYFRNQDKFYIIFIDDDYADGYIQYEPVDLTISDFLRNNSYIKEKPLKSYTIKIRDKSNKELKIIVKKDNLIDSILYYKD